MNKTLVIDTSSKNLYVMLLDDDKTTKITLLNSQKQHSVLLNKTIADLLSKTDTNLADIDIFAVCVGVGSFTGIRVGVSVAKAFNFACNKKFVEVNSLQTLAYTKKGCITCLADAGKGYYCAVYDGLKQLTPPTLIDEEEAKRLLTLQNTVCFEEETDYSDAIERLVREKVANSEFSTSLTPVYVRRCQAEEERDKQCQ